MSPTAASVIPVDVGLSPATVPAGYQGVWQRLLLRRVSGEIDTTTRVFWLQTPVWHGDIRIPADRPDFAGVTALHDCSDAQLDALCRQSGFAGTTRVASDLCEWQRRIDFQLSDDRDLGRMQFRGDELDEFGVESDYYEHWRRLPDSLGPAWAQPVLLPDPDRLSSILLVAGGYFMLLRDRPLAVPEAQRVRERIRSGTACREEREAFADFEISYGMQQDGVGRILLSTLPWREGQQVCLPAPV